MLQPIDKIWFDKLSAITAFSLVGKLAGDPKERRAQKKLFLSGQIDHPTLSYPRLAVFNIDNTRGQFESLKAEIVDSSASELIKKAYVLYIDEKLIHLAILDATKNGDDKTFARLVALELDVPSLDVLGSLKLHVQDMISQARDSGNILSITASDYISDLICNIPTSENSVFEKFVHEPDSDINAIDICRRFNTELEAGRIHGWHAIIDHDSRYSSIVIDKNSNRIIIPQHRVVNAVRLEALVKHEIGVHVVRRVNAKESPLLLLSCGLDHYLKGEEGLAKLEEHALCPSSMNSTIEIYFAISLATGLTGLHWNFSEVFNFFQNYYLTAHCNKRGLSKHNAQNYAWNRTIRLFRGTTGASSGICFTGELSYMHGYLALQALDATHPEEKQRYFCGKYDPANPVHRELLDEALGV